MARGVNSLFSKRGQLRCNNLNNKMTKKLESLSTNTCDKQITNLDLKVLRVDESRIKY